MKVKPGYLPKAAWIAAAVLMLALAGCETVQPWEREEHSHYSMRPDADPLAGTLAEHVFFTREASFGGTGVGGGGCGCN